MIRPRMLIVFMILGSLAIDQIRPASSEPYRPADDNQVLEQLSFKLSNPVARELKSMRTDLRNNPRHLESAVKLATRYIEQNRSEGIHVSLAKRRRPLPHGGTNRSLRPPSSSCAPQSGKTLTTSIRPWRISTRH